MQDTTRPPAAPSGGTGPPPGAAVRGRPGRPGTPFRQLFQPVPVAPGGRPVPPLGAAGGRVVSCIVCS